LRAKVDKVIAESVDLVEGWHLHLTMSTSAFMLETSVALASLPQHRTHEEKHEKVNQLLAKHFLTELSGETRNKTEAQVSQVIWFYTQSTRESNRRQQLMMRSQSRAIVA
jgi:hypothetical protein